MNIQKGKLSSRAYQNLSTPVPLRELLIKAIPLLYHPTNNPDGVINMGLAHSDLMRQELVDKINQCLEFNSSLIDYGDPHGSRYLRKLVAELMNRHFNPAKPLDFNHCIVVPGAGASVWQFIHTLTDPGDNVLVLAPYYGNFDLDVCVGTGVDLVPLYPHSALDTGIDVDLLEKEWSSKHEIHHKAKVLLVTNPRNPQGSCYSMEDLKNILIFASKNELHVIFDEVYGLSTFSYLETDHLDPFISALSIKDIENYIDPQCVHIVYGMSKDFSINGLRVGFVISQYNELVIANIKLTSMFGYMSSVEDKLLCNLLKDTKWIDTFIETNKQRLKLIYGQTTEYMKQLGIDFIPCDAGLFIIADTRHLFQKHQKEITFKLERDIWELALKNKVYVMPGYAFHTLDPGYFRLTFTLDWHLVQLGLDRFYQTLQQFLK
ncbi:unnamed protein product [Cunninghamella blakesleeana]